MRRLFEHKTAVFLIIATIVLAVVIGAFSAANREKSAVENIGGSAAASAQGAVSGTGGFIGGIFDYFGSVKKLKEENDRLKSENINLQKQLRDTEGLQKENGELRAMLDLKKKETRVEMVAASVSAKNPSNWYSSFTINRGANDGIKKNQAVVNSNRELVGQILSVGDTFAEVITILDSQSSIGAEIARSKGIGIVEGDANLRYSGYCRLSYIARDTDIQTGDFVETSGLGGIFPKGLLIGTVTEVYEENATMSKAATIEPLAEIERLNEVFVITDYTETDLSVDISTDDEEETEQDDDEDEE